METPSKRSSISRKPIGGQKAVNVANAVQATQSPPLSPTQQNINFPVPNHPIDYDIPADMPNRPGTFSYGLSSLAETTPLTSPSNNLNTNLVQSPTQVVGPDFKTIPHPSNNIVSSPPLSGYTAGLPSPPPSFSSASQSVTEEDHTTRSATSYFPPNIVPLSSVTGIPLTVNNTAIATEANQATATNPNLPKSVSHTIDNHIPPNETNLSPLSTSAPPDLKFPHDRHIESASFASLCCQCSSAVPYDVFYYRCTYCRLDICGTCFQSGKHPWAHLPSLIRLKAQETKAGDRRQDMHHSSCNEMSHCRLDCDECEYSICSSCFEKEKVGPHQHRSFTLVTPPGLTLSGIRDNGLPCCLEPSFGHCGRCYAPWKPEEWIIQCKTCVFEFDEVAGLCSSCDAEVLSACRQKDHQLVAMKCRQKMKDEGGVGPAQEIQVMVECTECPSHFHSMTDIAFLRHSHSNYSYVFFTNDREEIFASTYRNCKKKAARVDIPLAPTETSVECSYCQHKFPAEVMQSCLACSETKYCPHCFPIASSGHQDGLTNFVSENDVKQIKLGGGWTQRINSEGRIWYQNAKTNKSTFETPSKITTLGNEKPPNQRRATTGQIPTISTAGTESAAGSRLPPGWEARKTMEGRRYYVCHATKQTSWERPTAPDVTQPAKPKAQKKRQSSMPLVATPQTPVAANPATLTQGVVTQAPGFNAPGFNAPGFNAPGFNAAVASPSTEVPMTAEEKHAAKVAAQKKKQRNKMMMKIGTSVLKGVVSGAIQSA